MNKDNYRTYQRVYHREHYHKEANRAQKLRRKYGLTPDDYESMLADQGGVCALCGQLPGEIRLAVDHDHETNRVRGLLCSNCNVALGMIGDSLYWLSLAQSYLTRSN